MNDFKYKETNINRSMIHLLHCKNEINDYYREHHTIILDVMIGGQESSRDINQA